MRTYLIIGAQKAGTTSLYNYLIQHPQVLPAATKEVHYFDLHYANGEDWYWEQLRGCGPVSDGLITGESSPYYLYHPLVPERVRRLLPEAKLIVLLRNPVARAVSHYYHLVMRLKAEPLSLEEAFAQEAERLRGVEEKLAGGEAEYSYTHQLYSYLSRGIYADQLERWFEHFPREQFLILRSEEMYANPGAIYRRVLAFLGLAEFEPKEFGKHYALDYPAISTELEAQLSEFFRPHNRRLERLVGQNFGW